MNRKEKLRKMYEYCDGRDCKSCKVYKENPKGLCGAGRGYSEKTHPVSDEELNINYNIVFGKKEDEKMNKFKVGDRVRIIGNCNVHEFKNGEIVVLKELWDDSLECSNGRGFTAEREIGRTGYCNIVREKDLEYVNESTQSSRTFTITTSDTTTTLTDGTHTTSINRYYTDKHDDMVALEEVVKKYKSEMEEIERAEKMPKVGDKVKIIDKDRTYSTYYKWFFENKITDDCVMRWQYNCYPNNSPRAFRVVAIGKHNRDDVVIALIADDVYTYLINIEGIEVIK